MKKFSSLGLALSFGGLVLALPVRAQVTAPINPGGGGQQNGLLGQIFGFFQFLEPLFEGGSIAIAEIEELFPFLDTLGVGLGELGLPISVDIDTGINAREPSPSDIFFGLGSTLPGSTATELLRARTRVSLGSGVAGTILSEDGQEAAATALETVQAAAAATETNATAIATLDQQGQQATTTFDRVGIQLAQQREAALQAQRTAEINAQVFSALQQNGAMQATQLEVSTQQLQADISSNTGQLRQDRGTSSLLRNARAGALVFGGQP